MKTDIKKEDQELELICKSILLFEQMDTSILAKDRIIFLRLFFRFGDREFSVKNLIALGEQIGINHIALKKSLKNLMEKGQYIEMENNCIKIKFSFMYRFFPSIKERYSIESELVEESILSSYKLPFLLVRMFKILYEVKISHKQKNTHDLVEINYQQWLVLISMVMLSDRSGVVHGAGTYELSKHTGMNRDALLRAITALFKLGIIRSKIRGTLNNNLLKSTDAIYFLNLSSSIWGENKKFGDFYLVNMPKEYFSVVSKSFKLIENLNKDDRKNYLIEEIRYVSSENKGLYKIEEGRLVEDIKNEFNFVCNYKKNFYFDMILQKNEFNNINFQINNFEHNVYRLEALMSRFVFFVIKNLEQAQIMNNYQMLFNDTTFFNGFLKETTLNREDFVKPDESELIERRFTMQVEAFRSARSTILCIIAKAVLHSEILPVLRLISAVKGDQYRFNNIVSWPAGHERKCQRIFYLPSNDLEKDNFHLVDFNKEDGNQKLYEMVSQKVELSFDEQKDYGLLSSKE